MTRIKYEMITFFFFFKFLKDLRFISVHLEFAYSNKIEIFFTENTVDKDKS